MSDEDLVIDVAERMDIVIDTTQTLVVIDVPPANTSPIDIFTGAPGAPGAPGTIVAVSPTPPPNPAVNALWVDTS